MRKRDVTPEYVEFLEARIKALDERVYELEHPEPVHKEFGFACPHCGAKALLSFDMFPREDEPSTTE